VTDVGIELLRGVSAFGATRLGDAATGTFKDSKSLLSSLANDVSGDTKTAAEKLKADIEAGKAEVESLAKAIEKQTALIKKMADDSVADANAGNFTAAEAGRIAVRIGTALLAIDEAVGIVATKLATGPDKTVDKARREDLIDLWNPWVKPFKDLGGGAGKMLDSFGRQVLGVPDATGALAKTLKFERDQFRLTAQLAGLPEKSLEVLKLNSTRLEAFLGFKQLEVLNPPEDEKAKLVEREGKWWRADEAVFGLRLYTVIEPGLQKDPLLKKVMPGSQDPKSLKPTAITLDSAGGLYLGDGRGAGNERVSLPIQFNSSLAEVRELTLGLVRNQANEVSGLELTTVVAGKLGSAVGVQAAGAGAKIALDGTPKEAGGFPLAASAREADAVGLRIAAGPIKGGGFIERKERAYGPDPSNKLVEYGGVIQLEILKVGVSAIVILSPEPFSLVLVIGVRFPKAIELSFGFTLNGVGGILALDRRVDSGELIKGMQSHFLDRVLFPADPAAEAPKLLDQVAKVFPQQDGGFVVGPIVELGWGSEAKIVEAKLGIILALPDPKLILLGAVRVRAPAKDAPLTDFRCEVYGEIDADRLLIIATLRDSKIAGIAVSGDLGLLIQWGGGGAFALSVGGFNPRYNEAPAELKDLERLTMNLSPPSVVTIVVKAYFAVTAGAVMAGVRGDLKADVGVAKAHAWLQLDMIFTWSPRFGFAIDLEIGIAIEVFGRSFASIQFRGSLEGTTPWKIEGRATVAIRFLPDYHFHLGPFEWGEKPPAVKPAVSPLELVQEAMREKEAWKAVMPRDGDLLVELGEIEAEGLIAHPLAALEIAQSRVPLETQIDRIGSTGVTANRVTMGLVKTSAGDAAAVSTVTAPFSPGQFMALEGEALLARSGFEQKPSGCRASPATTPISGAGKTGKVRWHTFFREKGHEHKPVTRKFDPRMFSAVITSLSPPAQAIEQRENAYLSRPQKVDSNPAATPSILPPGAATIRLADDGKEVLADLGVLSASEAGRVADAVNASGEAKVAAVALGAL